MARREGDFSNKTKRVIALRAGYHCSNPDCRRLTVGPNSDPEKFLELGEAAHIRSASPGDRDYDPQQTPEERKSASNGIWLCVECHTRVHKDRNTYSSDLLLEWKQRHESWISNREIVPSFPDVSLRTLTGIRFEASQPDILITGQDVNNYMQHELTIVKLYS